MPCCAAWAARNQPLCSSAGRRSSPACGENRCDAVLADALTAYYLLRSHADSGLSLLPVSTLNRHPSAVCLAVRKGATELRHSLDRALHDMELDGSLRRAHHRYFPFAID